MSIYNAHNWFSYQGSSKKYKVHQSEDAGRASRGRDWSTSGIESTGCGRGVTPGRRRPPPEPEPGAIFGQCTLLFTGGIARPRDVASRRARPAPARLVRHPLRLLPDATTMHCFDHQLIFTVILHCTGALGSNMKQTFNTDQHAAPRANARKAAVSFRKLFTVLMSCFIKIIDQSIGFL